jgi:hypothetical protein
VAGSQEAPNRKYTERGPQEIEEQRGRARKAVVLGVPLIGAKGTKARKPVLSVPA